MNNTLKYLEELINIPSPTGFTNEIQNYLLDKLSNFGYSPIKTNKGNILVEVKGNKDAKKRLLTAHVDTLGAIVKSVKPSGRLRIDKVGGFPYNMIEGENCLVHTIDNKEYSGTILLHQTSCHVYKGIEEMIRNQDNMEVRLDEKTFTKEDTLKLGINAGDFISFSPRFHITKSGFVKSRFLDDKVSAAILLDLLEKYSKNGEKLPYTTYFMFSVLEEVGIGANSSISKDVVEYLAIDMGAIGDYQETDEYTVSICAKDSSGPYNYNFRNHLINLCKENDIKYKVDIYPNYGSDASAAMRAGKDIKHALIGAGIESSHSYERTHIDSIKETYSLIEKYLKSNLVL